MRPVGLEIIEPDFVKTSASVMSGKGLFLACKKCFGARVQTIPPSPGVRRSFCCSIRNRRMDAYPPS
jgi:hypothetical protein